MGNSRTKKKLFAKGGITGPQGPPGAVNSVNSGTDITVDNTDPVNPIINYTGGGGGAGVTITPITEAALQALVGALDPTVIYNVTDAMFSYGNIYVTAFDVSTINPVFQGTFKNPNMVVPVNVSGTYDLTTGIITSIYEPLGNNYFVNHDTTVITVASNFAFDLYATNFNNKFIECYLGAYDTSWTFQDNTFETFYIGSTGGGWTSMAFIGNTCRGNRGFQCPNGYEIYLDGNGSTFEGNIMEAGNSSYNNPAAFIDTIGASSIIVNNKMAVGSGITFNSFSSTCVRGNILDIYSNIDFQADSNNVYGNTLKSNSVLTLYVDVDCDDNILEPQSSVDVYTSFRRNKIGALSIIDTSGGAFERCVVGNDKSFTTVTSHTGSSWIGNTSTFKLDVTADCDMVCVLPGIMPVAVNDFITGGTSGATGYIGSLSGSNLVVGQINGTPFTVGETITGAPSLGTATITSVTYSGRINVNGVNELTIPNYIGIANVTGWSTSGIQEITPVGVVSDYAELTIQDGTVGGIGSVYLANFGNMQTNTLSYTGGGAVIVFGQFNYDTDFAIFRWNPTISKWVMMTLVLTG